MLRSSIPLGSVSIDKPLGIAQWLHAIRSCVGRALSNGIVMVWVGSKLGVVYVGIQRWGIWQVLGVHRILVQRRLSIFDGTDVLDREVDG